MTSITNADLQTIAKRLEPLFPGAIDESEKLDVAAPRPKGPTEWMSAAGAGIAVARIVWSLLPSAEEVIIAIKKDGLQGKSAPQHLFDHLMAQYRKNALINKARWTAMAREVANYLAEKYIQK